MDPETLVVAAVGEGERLDKWLCSKFEGRFSRTYFQSMIEEGLILLNGERVKKRIKPEIGDEIEVEWRLEPQIDLTPENIPLKILYEDSDLLVIDKPVGMVVHPAPGHWGGTFVNALLYHCKVEGGEALRPGVVHRLDKDTSGLLVAVKTAVAHRLMVEAFASRSVHKEYLAICCGSPPEGIIDAAIGRHPTLRKQMAVVMEGGRSAVSIVERLKSNGSLSLVKVLPKTGRTHQIRVHLKHVGCPILGDAVYGSEKMNAMYGAKRQMLHAHLLKFNHPITCKPLEFEAAIPEDMQLMIRNRIEIKK